MNNNAVLGEPVIVNDSLISNTIPMGKVVKKRQLLKKDSEDRVKPTLIDLTNKTLVPVVPKEKKVKCSQRQSWFFTWNDYTEDDVQLLYKSLILICLSFIFQEELGKGVFCMTEDADKEIIKIELTKGTRHLQGVIFLKKKMRWSEFNLPSAIHWEGTRSKKHAINYCQKADTRNGKIYSLNINITRKLIIECDVTLESMYGWQKEIYGIFKKPVNKRLIYWLYERDGGLGKSEFIKYLGLNNIALENAMVNGKDMINLLNNYLCDDKGVRNELDLKALCIDIPKAFNLKTIQWSTIESIKNGSCMNTKYKSQVLRFNRPHIVIFSNYPPPDLKKISIDRWVIGKITKDKILWEDITMWNDNIEIDSLNSNDLNCEIKPI